MSCFIFFKKITFRERTKKSMAGRGGGGRCQGRERESSNTDCQLSAESKAGLDPTTVKS